MSNEELVVEIQSGHNTQNNLEALWNQTEKFIAMVVKPYSKYCEMDDLMQESYFALLDAVNGFDVEYGTGFLTYLFYKVKAKASRYSYNNLSDKRVSIPMQERIQKYKGLIQQLGRIPSDQDAMKALNLSQKQYDNMVKAMYEMTCISLDSPLQGTETGMTIEDTVSDGTDFESDVDDAISLSGIWECVDELDDKKKEVILNRFKDGMTLNQVSDELGVSQESVRQIEKKALKTLHGMEKVQSLANWFGYTSQKAYSSGLIAMKNGKGSNVEYLAIRHIEYEKEQRQLMQEFDDMMRLVNNLT